VRRVLAGGRLSPTPADGDFSESSLIDFTLCVRPVFVWFGDRGSNLIVPVGTSEVIFVPRVSGFGVSWRRQRPGWLMTDARHGNSILNIEQQVFTHGDCGEKAEEK